MKTDNNSLGALAKKFNCSGLSVSRFCLQHGLEVEKFKKIIYRYRDNNSKPIGIFYPFLLVEFDQVPSAYLPPFVTCKV
jgi:hypothetical protein